MITSLNKTVTYTCVFKSREYKIHVKTNAVYFYIDVYGTLLAGRGLSRCTEQRVSLIRSVIWDGRAS
jgi:hypothetical protein